MAGDYDWGKAATMRCWREYVGLRPDEMAAVLRIAPRSYKRFENGQAAIPRGIWEKVGAVVDRFDDAVTDLLDAADKGPMRVRVWRGVSTEQPLPGMWLRTVAMAMRENPDIEPYFPEDKGQEGERLRRASPEDGEG